MPAERTLATRLLAVTRQGRYARCADDALDELLPRAAPEAVAPPHGRPSLQETTARPVAGVTRRPHRRRRATRGHHRSPDLSSGLTVVSHRPKVPFPRWVVPDSPSAIGCRGTATTLVPVPRLDNAGPSDPVGTKTVSPRPQQLVQDPVPPATCEVHRRLLRRRASGYGTSGGFPGPSMHPVEVARCDMVGAQRLPSLFHPPVGVAGNPPPSEHRNHCTHDHRDHHETRICRNVHVSEPNAARIPASPSDRTSFTALPTEPIRASTTTLPPREATTSPLPDTDHPATESADLTAPNF